MSDVTATSIKTMLEVELRDKQNYVQRITRELEARQQEVDNLAITVVAFDILDKRIAKIDNVIERAKAVVESYDAFFHKGCDLDTKADLYRNIESLKKSLGELN